MSLLSQVKSTALPYHFPHPYDTQIGKRKFTKDVYVEILIITENKFSWNRSPWLEVESSFRF